MDRIVQITTNKEADGYIKAMAEKHQVSEEHILRVALDFGLSEMIQEHLEEQDDEGQP